MGLSMTKRLIAVVLIRSVQAVLAWILAFGLILASPLAGGEGRSLIVFALTAAFVIWFVGILLDYVFLKERRAFVRSLLVTVIGSGLGVFVLFIPGLVVGFQGLLFPLIGALAAYHFSGR